MKETALKANDQQGRESSQWWKEPMMWLVLALPATVVVAGIWTFILAS